MSDATKTKTGDLEEAATKSPLSRSRRTDSNARRSSLSSSSSYSDESSVPSSPSRRQDERPRFDSRASWADSTRFDMGRSDSRVSDLSAKDFRLTVLGRSPSMSQSRGYRSDSRVSRLSRSSSRSSMSGSERGRQSSFVSNFGVTKGKKRRDSTALSTITENWNVADDQYGSPFTEMDVHGEWRKCS
uniref:Uncharacterized protein n=1 Tax=Hyaloperonospora arabidopsidis (strain Emoy2) TaxID=559515 RepID=M4C305_HYAAE